MFLLKAHRSGKRADRKQATADANGECAQAKQRGGIDGCCENHCSERKQSNKRAKSSQSVRIGLAGQLSCGQGKSDESARGQQGGQPRGCAEPKVQDFAAIRFQQNVLHAESCRSQANRDQESAGSGAVGKRFPGCAEGGSGRRVTVCRGAANLLLPGRDDVEQQSGKSGPLHDLNQS